MIRLKKRTEKSIIKRIDNCLTNDEVVHMLYNMWDYWYAKYDGMGMNGEKSYKEWKDLITELKEIFEYDNNHKIKSMLRKK